MMHFSYRYETTIRWSSAVTAHSWLQRCVPVTCSFQKGIGHTTLASVGEQDRADIPVPVSTARDAFGNTVQWGYVDRAHRVLRIVSMGSVRQTPYRICDTVHPVYFSHTDLTRPDAAMSEFLYAMDLPAPIGFQGKPRDAADLPKDHILLTVYRLGSALHELVNYVPGSTLVDTPAAEAFSQKCGVCQDYAHMMLAFLRASGIAARYVCGFIQGEGETHAWVEFFNGGVWLPYDPTHNTLPKYGYIKLAHGRDSRDCSVNRGVYTGPHTDQQTVSVTVEEQRQ